MTLTRCRRCRQPILHDARCCPHCAVARPSRKRRRTLVLAGLLALAAALALGSLASGPPAPVPTIRPAEANVTTIPKTVPAGPLRRPPRAGDGAPE